MSRRYLYDLDVRNGLIVSAPLLGQLLDDDLPRVPGVAGGYSNASVIVDQYGRIIGASSNAGAGEYNEARASAVVGGGGFTDQFPGTSLDAAWVDSVGTFVVASGVKNSVLNLDVPSTVAWKVRAYAPAGAFRVESRIIAHIPGTVAGIGVKDSAASEAAINCVGITFNGSGGLVLFKIVAGAVTTVATIAFADSLFGKWLYVAIQRDGSNNWLAYYSWDRALWQAFASSFAFSFTVAQAGYRVSSAGWFGSDFFDVVS